MEREMHLCQALLDLVYQLRRRLSEVDTARLRHESGVEGLVLDIDRRLFYSLGLSLSLRHDGRSQELVQLDEAARRSGRCELMDLQAPNSTLLLLIYLGKARPDSLCARPGAAS